MSHMSIGNGAALPLAPLSCSDLRVCAANGLGKLDAASMQALCAALAKLTALQEIDLGGECHNCMFVCARVCRGVNVRS